MGKFRLLFLLIIISFSSVIKAQVSSVTLSGIVTNTGKAALPYTNVILKSSKDNAFVSGTITNEEGRYSLTEVKPGNYQIEVSVSGYETYSQPLFVGSLSEFLDIPPVELGQHLNDKETKIEEIVLTNEKKK